MKAWHVPSFGLEHLELKELPKPKPGPGEVLVRVHAVSLNYRDLLTIRGQYNPKMFLPRIPCSDAAGEVAEVGDGVKNVSAGQRVAGIFMQNWLDGRLTPERGRGALGGDIDGVLAEYALFREQGVVSIPEHLSYAEAAILPCAGVTAWNALVHAGRVKAGDVVVIQGTGGVSIFALQFAKMLGARILGTSSSDEKLERARSMGLGADLIVEVGGAGTFHQSLKAVRMGGVVAQIGILSRSDQPAPILAMIHRQVQIKGIYIGSRAQFEEMNRAIEENYLRPVVDRVFLFDQARQALKTMETSSHFGKIVIQVVA